MVVELGGEHTQGVGGNSSCKDVTTLSAVVISLLINFIIKVDIPDIFRRSFQILIKP